MKKYKTDYFGFIYMWYNRVSKRFYLGSHFGAYDDGYICSSKSMKLAYQRNPSSFMRRIVYWHINDNATSLKEEETKWLSLIPDDYLNDKYYNKTKVANGGSQFWTEETNRIKSEGLKRSWTLQRRQQASKRMKEQSIEQRQKHSQLMKQLHAQGHYPNNKFQHITNEQRIKNTQLRKGLKYSKEAKHHMSVAAKIRANKPEHIKRFLEMMKSVPTEIRSNSQKGHIPWNKGIPMSDSAKTKLSISQKTRLLRVNKNAIKRLQKNTKAQKVTTQQPTSRGPA